MRLLSPGFVEAWRDKIINIHPSLLPLFPGLDTHARALAAGVRIHGATVHFVRAEVDSGPIIAQGAVPVLAGRHAGDARRARAQQSSIAFIRWRLSWWRAAARRWSATASRSTANVACDRRYAALAAATRQRRRRRCRVPDQHKKQDQRHRLMHQREADRNHRDEREDADHDLRQRPAPKAASRDCARGGCAAPHRNGIGEDRRGQDISADAVVELDGGDVVEDVAATTARAARARFGTNRPSISGQVL